MPPSDDLAVPERSTEVAARLDAVRLVLAHRGLAGALLSTRRNFAWLTAGGSNHVVLASEVGAAPVLVTRGRSVVLAPVSEVDRIRDEELAGTGLALETVPWEDPGAARAAARRLAGGPVADDAAIEPDLVPTRSVLRPFEVDRLAWLAGVVEDGVDAGLTDAAGATELELCATTLERVARLGVRAPVLLAAADDRIVRYRHPLPSTAVVRSRAMIVLVGERWGLHVALTRFRELVPPGPELVRRRAAAGKVLDALLAASRPGATLGEAFGAGVAAYAENGFADEWRAHHQGGLIGYQPRERIATPGDPFVLASGMAVAWNPSLAGAKAEATAVLEAAGRLRILTRGG